MENILRIIYDSSINGKILNLKNIEKILELLIDKKGLNDYISNIDVQHIGSNNLASYSNYSKKIVIYENVVELMLNNIEKNIKIDDYFQINLYKNFSILQVILHELEHANQEKITYNENSLEAFLLRLSKLVCDNELLYEYKPEERLAEIKSYDEILSLIAIIKDKTNKISSILETDKLQRLLRGYHLKKDIIECPLIVYFSLSEKEHLLKSFQWYSDNYEYTIKEVLGLYQICERFMYGFPITLDEYSESMKNIVLSTNKNFKNKIFIEM